MGELQSVQWQLMASGNPPDKATLKLLDDALGEWWKGESARYQRALREAVPNLSEDHECKALDAWVGTLHPHRLGYRSVGFHELDVEMILGKISDADDPIAAGFRYATSLEVLGKEAERDGALAPFAKEQGAAAALEAELGRQLRDVREFARSVALGSESSEGNRDLRERESVEEMTALDSWFASRVERLGEAGASLAKKIREEAVAAWRSSPPQWNLFEHWMPAGDPPVRASKAVRNLARVLWRDVVGRALERERKKQLEPARMPTDISKTFAIARQSGGRSEGGAIQVVPPSGLALMLPFDEDLKVTRRGGDTVSLRQVLSPNALRTYLATLVLFQDAGMRDDGSFEFEGAGAILDVTGAKKHEERKGTRTYARYATKDTKAVLDHLGTFTKVRVRVVGDLEAAVGDALLDEISDRRNGKVVTYAHARLIAARLKHDYLRLPRAVCKLAPSDVPLGMGIATIVRAKVLANLRNGAPIEQPLEQWLEACGIDGHEGARKEGRAYWRSIVEDLTRVAEEGRLGEMRAAGAGRDAVLTLSLHSDLSASYRPLLESSKAHERAKVSARIVSHRKRMK